jgi:hypothetical protein
MKLKSFWASKPWCRAAAGRSLDGFVGSRGYRTSTIQDEAGLIQIAAKMFQIPPARDVETMAAAVGAIPKKERRQRATEFMARRKGGSSEPPAPGVDAHVLLRRLVVALLNRGQGGILHEVPDLIEYGRFGLWRPNHTT